MVVLIWYLFALFGNGYINPFSKFDLKVASEISPFIGSFIAPLFTLASVFFVLENLKEFKKNNEQTIKK